MIVELGTGNVPVRNSDKVMKLTREQLIAAAERCNEKPDCRNCPFKEHEDDCITALIAALVEELKENCT